MSKDVIALIAILIIGLGFSYWYQTTEATITYKSGDAVVEVKKKDIIKNENDAKRIIDNAYKLNPTPTVSALIIQTIPKTDAEIIADAIGGTIGMPKAELLKIINQPRYETWMSPIDVNIEFSLSKNIMDETYKTINIILHNGINAEWTVGLLNRGDFISFVSFGENPFNIKPLETKVIPVTFSFPKPIRNVDGTFQFGQYVIKENDRFGMEVAYENLTDTGSVKVLTPIRINFEIVK